MLTSEQLAEIRAAMAAMPAIPDERLDRIVAAWAADDQRRARGDGFEAGS